MDILRDGSTYPTYHVSHVMCHVSCVTCHMSHVISKKKKYIFKFFSSFNKVVKLVGEVSVINEVTRLVMIYSNKYEGLMGTFKCQMDSWSEN